MLVKIQCMIIRKGKVGLINHLYDVMSDNFDF